LNFTKGSDNSDTYLLDPNDENNYGGAIHNAGNLTINNSTLDQNNSFCSGGAITSWAGSTLTVNNSTFSNNNAGAIGSGGAIYGYSNATVTINNSTFNGNSATADGFGGAIWIESGNLTVNNSTISGNTAGSGGGICGVTDANITLKNTIVDNNGTEDVRGTVTADNSLIQSLAGWSLAAGSNNITGQSANLVALANNGGITQTMMPNSDSPAINSGDDTGITGTDQRGEARIQDSHVDIGAVETNETAAPSATAPSAFVVSTPTTVDNGSNDDGKSSVTVTWIDSSTTSVNHYEIVAKAGELPSAADTVIVAGQTSIAKGTQTATFAWNAGDDLYVALVAVDENGQKTLCKATIANVTVAEDGHTAASSAKVITATSVGTLTNGNITEVPLGTKVSALKAGLTVSQNATLEILTATGGTEVADETNTDVTSTMMVKVTAQDGSSTEYSIVMSPTSYTVTFAAGTTNTDLADITGATNYVPTETVTEGTAYTAPVLSKTGYTFIGWFTDAACTTAYVPAANPITANATLYAKFAGEATVTNVAMSADGTKVLLTFNKKMADPTGNQNQFAVNVGGNPVGITGAMLNNIDDKIIELTLSSAAIFDTVTISYTNGTIATADGGKAQYFDNIALTNIRFEAEDATIFGANIENSMTASHGKDVGGFNTDGSSVTFNNLKATNALKISYATTMNGKFEMIINDGTPIPFSFTSTGGWQTYQTITVEAVIPEGATVKFRSENGTSDNVLNIDYIEYTPAVNIATTAPLASSITATNNIAGTDDTVVITGLAEGDVVKVYDAATGGTTLGTSTVAVGATSATVTVVQLGVSAGTVYVSVTSTGKEESTRTEKVYAAEPAESEVIVASGSVAGAAGGDKSITGLKEGKIYRITKAPTGTPVVMYSKADGTLTTVQSEKAPLSTGINQITDSTNLTNGTTYKVETNIVYSDADDGSVGTLRDVINNADSGDKITFADSVYGKTITLSESTDPSTNTDNSFTISENIIIEGPSDPNKVVTISGGTDQQIIDGNAQQIFNVESTGELTISNLKLINASEDNANNCGGAIYNGGNLTVDNVTFSDNNATSGGAAIYNNGTLSVTNSLFTDNKSSGNTPLGGAIYTDHDISIDSSTFTGNQIIGGDGGAIYGENCTVTIKNSTIQNNHADGSGGGIAMSSNENSVLVRSNDTITNNTAVVDSQNISIHFMSQDVLVGAKSEAEAGKVMLTVNKIVDTGNKIYYKVVDASTTETSIDDTITPSIGWNQVNNANPIEVSAQNGNVIEVVEVTSTNQVTKYNREIADDGYTAAATVILASGSAGTAGDTKITGLNQRTKYRVEVDGTTKYVKSDGTLSDNEADGDEILGTEITGLVNGQTYNVIPYVLKLYYVNGMSNTIKKVNVNGNGELPSDFVVQADDYSIPWFDIGKDKRLYYLSLSDSKIKSIKIDGTESVPQDFTNIQDTHTSITADYVKGLAIDKDTNYVYWAFSNKCTITIYRKNIATGSPVEWVYSATGLGSGSGQWIQDIKISNGYLYYCTDYNNIQKLNLDGLTANSNNTSNMVQIKAPDSDPADGWSIDSLAVDHLTSELYWSQPLEGIYQLDLNGDLNAGGATQIVPNVLGDDVQIIGLGGGKMYWSTVNGNIYINDGANTPIVNNDAAMTDASIILNWEEN